MNGFARRRVSDFAELLAVADNPDMLRVEIAELPASLTDIADLIGLPATLDLVDAWGGVRMYFPSPRALSDVHPLVQVLGGETAVRLCERFGGTDVLLPRALDALRRARDRLIHHEHAQGASGRTLALRYRLSERRLWEILATDPDPDAGTRAQMALF